MLSLSLYSTFIFPSLYLSHFHKHNMLSQRVCTLIISYSHLPGGNVPCNVPTHDRTYAANGDCMQHMKSRSANDSGNSRVSMQSKQQEVCALKKLISIISTMIPLFVFHYSCDHSTFQFLRCVCVAAFEKILYCGNICTSFIFQYCVNAVITSCLSASNDSK